MNCHDICQAALTEIMTRQAYDPMTDDDAQGLANEWYGMAVSNGVSSADLDVAAGMPLPAYILQIFGEIGQELEF